MFVVFENGGVVRTRCERARGCLRESGIGQVGEGFRVRGLGDEIGGGYGRQ